jgi:hypothetical protein
MNSTYNTVHDESVKTWKFQRLGLVLEFCNSSVLPAPLGILEDIFWIIRYIFRLVDILGRAMLSNDRRSSAIYRSMAWSASQLFCTEELLDSSRVVLLPNDGASPWVKWLPEDWFEWRALASVRYQQRLWGGWFGYFRHWNGRDLLQVCRKKGHPPPLLNSLDKSLSLQIRSNREEYTDDDNKDGHACVCLQCQGRLLRSSADAVVEALEAWGRKHVANDIERQVSLHTFTHAQAHVCTLMKLTCARRVNPFAHEPLPWSFPQSFPCSSCAPACMYISGLPVFPVFPCISTLLHTITDPACRF